jgi:N4-gp56 family major capsid protein
MATTYTSDITGLYSNIVQSALYTLNEQTIIRPVVRNYDMTGTPGLTAQVPIYPALSAAAVAEGTDLASTISTFTTSSKTLTASEVGVMVELSDLAAESANEDVAAAVGRQIGAAMAEKVDTDLAGLFSGFSNVVDKSSAAVTVQDIFKAAATLKANKADQNGAFVCVLHPYQAYDIKQQLTNAGATMNHSLSDVGNVALLNGFIGRIAGVDIFESTVVSGADSAGSYFGAVMTQDALGYMVKRSMRIETERNASKRSLEIVGSMAYAVSELFDEYGVAIKSDASAVI